MASNLSANPPADSDSRGWFKSSYSAASCTCVEVNLDGVEVLVRDSKRPASSGEPGADGPARDVITVERAQWAAFLADVQGDEPSRRCRTVALAAARDGSTTVTCIRSGTSLAFDADEWQAFASGVRAGEFSR